MKLFNPGPVNLTDGVRQALTSEDLCHREKEFASLQQQISQKLLGIYELSEEFWGSVLLSGSGTLAVEAMLTSLIPNKGGKVLIIANGVYGERMAKIAAAHGIHNQVVRFDWGERIDINLVQQALEEDPDITHIATVHHETTTGRLNALTELADLAVKFSIKILIDGVSSFGAEPVPFEHPAIGALAASSNKCLHGAPGLSFVIAQKNLLRETCQPPRSVYLDLNQYYQAQQQASVPFTPAIPAFYALNQALDELISSGGWPARHQEYQDKANYLAAKLAQMGISPLLALADSSVVLRSFRLPGDIDYEQLHAHLRAAGMVIYAGQGQLGPKIFRLSTMGMISHEDIDRLSAAIMPLMNNLTCHQKQEIS